MIEEENELLRLFISLEAFPSGVYQGNPYSAVVLIIDDDIDSIDENSKSLISQLDLLSYLDSSVYSEKL